MGRYLNQEPSDYEAGVSDTRLRNTKLAHKITRRHVPEYPPSRSSYLST